MFAWMFLRPVAARNLEPPVRLQLWVDVFARFFPWVWVSVVAILASGVWTLMQMGFPRVPGFWHAMLGMGVLMMLIFIFVYTSPYVQLKKTVAAGQWAAAGAALGVIRRWVGINLVLGFATIAVAIVGRLIL